MASADPVKGRQAFYFRYNQAIKATENKIFERMTTALETFNDDHDSDFNVKLEKLIKEAFIFFKNDKQKDQKIADLKKYLSDKFEKTQKERSENKVPKERFSLLYEKIKNRCYRTEDEKNHKKDIRKAEQELIEKNLTKNLLNSETDFKEEALVEKKPELREEEIKELAPIIIPSHEEEIQQRGVKEKIENQPSVEASGSEILTEDKKTPIEKSAFLGPILENSDGLTHIEKKKRMLYKTLN